MSQKNAKRLRALEGCVEDLEEQAEYFAYMLEAIEEKVAKTGQIYAERRRADRAEWDAERWRRVAFGAVGTAIIVEIIAVAATWAKADELPALADDGPTIITTAEVIGEEPEAEENQLIEAALLARAVRLDDVAVTHYDTCVDCCGKDDGITASGVQAVPGVSVAVDPAVIPLGSDVLVDYGDGSGLQYYRADDTGHGVDGKAIDLCVASHAEAVELGRRTATVYFVPPEEGEWS
jgi:3D (Asp-Asp-Asp) domain-containing protein